VLGQMIREHTRFTRNLMPRKIDLEVRTLEDPDEGNVPLIIRVLRNNMKGECRSPLDDVDLAYKHEYENLMPLEMISYMLYDENSSFKDDVSTKIGKVHVFGKRDFIEFQMIFQ